MPANLLTDKTIQAALRAAAVSGKPKRVSDGLGLHLEAQPDGKGWWRLRYWLNGREGRMSLGVYPAVPLAGRWFDERKRKSGDRTGYLPGARDLRDEARALVAAGFDPVDNRRQAKSEAEARAITERLAAEGKPVPGTFEFVAREWLSTIHAARVSSGHCERTRIRFEQMVFPLVGCRPVGEIEPPELLTMLRSIESRGTIETAHRVKNACGQVFRFAIASGLASRNPAADLRDALRPVRAKHFAAPTTPDHLADLLRAIDGYRGHPLTCAALRLTTLLLLRPGELRHLEWVWIDETEAAISIPSTVMKRSVDGKANGPPHWVPLARQALEIFSILRPLAGSSRFVFPSSLSRTRPMSENTVRAAIRRLGFEDTAHGLSRATARTLAVERLGIDPAVVEAQLGHGSRESLGRAYDRAEYRGQRRELMQRWADYVDRLRGDAAASRTTR